MLNLIEELKNTFKVKQLNTNEKFTRLETGWFDTHNKAVKAIIEMLEELGYEEIILPYMPPPYIINDRGGNHQGVISLCKK